MTKPSHLTLSLSLACALAALPVPVMAAPAGDSAARVEALLAAPRFDRNAASALYRSAEQAGNASQLDARLDAAAADTRSMAHVRARALLVRSVIDWQRGDGAAAIEAVERALAFSPGPDGWLLKAQLLDAAGHAGEAAGIYIKAAGATTDPREKSALLLRAALAGDLSRPAALAGWTRSGDAVARHHGAQVLALLGDTADARTLYHPAQAGAAGYADFLRLADWALASGDATAAAARAWQAYGLAATPVDRRYALAVMVESYRVRKDMNGAYAFLAAGPDSAEIAQVKVDALLELGRFDEAIALVSASRDPALRQRLLGILDLAGRGAEGVEEYRRSIAAAPDRLEGYTALAELYLGQGKRDAAVAVYREFFTRNTASPELLLAAGRQMIAADMRDEATALIAQAAARPSMAVPARFFRIEVDRAQGRDGDALGGLSALDRMLPPTDPQRVTVADTYDAMGHRREALAVLRQLEARDPALDYDQRVHIATLAMANGDNADAMMRWRQLWQQATLPARKSYLAKQLIRSARAAGQLDGLTKELETALAAGKAGSGEIGLLTELRIAGNQRDAAIADIERFARITGMSETTRLNELVTVYTRLKAWPEANDALRRLITADRTNADIYLRQLTVNAARFGPDGESAAVRDARIEDLLGQMQKVAGFDNGEALRFAAAVHAAAGDDARAAADWRRALVADPGNVDSLVQLADVLKKQQRYAEAAAMLQYVAESTPDDGAFGAAVSALLTVIAPGEGGPPPPELVTMQAGVQGWAVRAVLARMAMKGPDTRLRALLADIAQASADFPLQLRAYAESLPDAGDQRPAILRTLVTLTSGAAGQPDQGGPAIGNVAYKLAYGRRLIALKREFPPDVYTDLARTLLAVNDVSGAERAFSMMTGAAGLVDVDRIKGDTYARQGMVEQALLNYDRALLRNRDDVDLVVRTAILREQRGDDPQAFSDYWRALQALIRRMPEGNAAADQDVGLDVRQYYPTLVEGLLLTWPEGGLQDGSPATRDAVKALFAASAAGLPSGPAERIADHGRLGLVADLARRVSARLGDADLAAEVARVLASHFPADEAVANADQGLAGEMGWDAAPSAPSADWVDAGLAAQASISGNTELAQALALGSDDDAAIRLQVATAMADETARKARERQSGGFDGSPAQLFGLVAKAMDSLSPERMRALVLAPIEQAPYRDEFLFDFFRTGGGRYAKLEKIAGHPLLDNARMLDLMVTRGSLPPPSSRALYDIRRDPSARPEGMIASFSVADKLALYEGMVARMEQSGTETAFQAALVKALFEAGLSTAQQQRFFAALSRDIAYDRGLPTKSAAFMVDKVLIPDVAPGNRDLILRAARAVADRYDDGRNLPGFLDAFLAGRKEEAYSLLMALQADTMRHYQGRDYAAPLVEAYFAEQEQHTIDAFMADPHPSPAAIAAFYRKQIVTADMSGTKGQRARIPRYYDKLVSLEPDNPVWLAGLLGSLWNPNGQARFVALLTGYVARHGDDKEASSVLQLAEALFGQEVEARALGRSSGADIANADWLVEMGNRADAAQAADFRRLFAVLYEDYRNRFANDPAVVEAERRRALGRQQQASRVDDSPVSDIEKSLAAGPAAIRATLRGHWRATAPRDDGEGAPDMERAAFAQALPDPDGVHGQGATGQSGALVAMLENPAITQEMERWLAALAPSDRRRQERLYALVAAGLERQGVVASRMATGLAALRAGTISPDELQLLSVLLDRAKTVPTQPDLQALASRLSRQDMLTALERARLARLFGRGGNYDAAGALMEAALLQIVYASGSDGLYGDDQAVLLTGMVANLRTWSDATAARRVYDRLTARIGLELGTAARTPPFDKWPQFEAQAEAGRDTASEIGDAGS
ncbi:tetratricopeptide repeat protein [Novosphingobium sp. 11B]